MAFLVALPFELVEHILTYCQQVELYALTRVSKSLYAVAIPLLYRHVDLRIQPQKLPRIDKFYFNIAEEPNIAKHVRSLCVGVSAEDGVKNGQRLLPRFSDSLRAKYNQAMDLLLSTEPWILKDSALQHSIESADYGVFATLALFIVPSLHRLEISDHGNATLSFFLKVLTSINRGISLGFRHDPQSFATRLSNIQEISFNVDTATGLQHSNQFSHTDLSPVFSLPGIRKLEFYVPYEKTAFLFGHPAGRWTLTPLAAPMQPAGASITNLIIRHSISITHCLRHVLVGTPRLQSLTCEIWHDYGKVSTDRIFNHNSSWIDLARWNSDLSLVKDTLQILVLSVEYCDSKRLPFQQPNVREQFSGHLDLIGLSGLHTLEVPVPFITGDPDFSIAAHYEPRLPLSMRHLCLRTDMSRAQFAFPLAKTQELTFEETHEDMICQSGARMDLSYLFQASQHLLDHNAQLESISIWQPAEPSMDWFKGQLQDLATACKNKSVMGKMIYPQMIRLKNHAHWNLVKEMTLFDPVTPDRGWFARFMRGERSCGIPLGLATQYHLTNFIKHKVDWDLW